MFEKGEHISYANCGMPYYIGNTIEERKRLFVQTPVSFGNRYDVDVRTLQEVTAIDREAHTVEVKNLRNGKRRFSPCVVSATATKLRCKLLNP